MMIQLSCYRSKQKGMVDDIAILDISTDTARNIRRSPVKRKIKAVDDNIGTT